MSRQLPEREETPVKQATPPLILTNGEEGDEDSDRGKKKGRKGLSKNKSLVKLSSSDDLLGRRMQGLTSGLTGTAAEN